MGKAFKAVKDYDPEIEEYVDYEIYLSWLLGDMPSNNYRNKESHLISEIFVNRFS
ncbi:hypothetical protein QQ008_09015 [Fulvivirgaceae bacterium BMA10]|uniref:Uncharacterized protein n=1 Tax=Splendidivirga corallicola TaxID=3051826 RepID=A0ABT8KLA6_9BACT|nr:hypothetical protein [Fulvivirgaceae bacterium BMA10]